MKVAYLNETGTERRIVVDDYTEDMSGKIFCAEGHPVIAKRGTIKTHHFAHKANTLCSCSDGMTDWHSDWQDRADHSCQEIRFNITDKKLTSNTSHHIADLCIDRKYHPLCNEPSEWKGYIIEFQHSRMDEKTMREREAFYTSQGYSLVWVFDTSSWTYTNIRKYNDNGVTRMTIRRKSGDTFPTYGAYTGKITKVYDFGKSELFVVTEQKGASITGYIISMEEFDRKYLGSGMKFDNDLRPFRHPL